MNTTKIKICGIKRKEDIDALNLYKPDFAGFVFAPSKRQVSFQEAKELKKNLCTDIKTVGVFVNENPQNILKLANEGVIDIIQLHGDENETYIQGLKKIFNTPIIKAISVKSFEELKNIPGGADYLLFDTYCCNMRGGSGKTFKWEILKNFNRPYFLAGGLNFDNILKAVDLLHPYCIDISSGAETNGVKDEKKISAIIKLIKKGAKNSND